jgi:protein TonB
MNDMIHSSFRIFLLILLFAGFVVSCSQLGPSQPDEVYLLNQLDVAPEFEGGYDQFIRYLSESIKNATEGTFDQLEGKIFIDFVIDEEGKVSQVSIKTPIPLRAGRELKSILENSPAWTPGQLNGQPVASFQTLPIKF